MSRHESVEEAFKGQSAEWRECTIMFKAYCGSNDRVNYVGYR